MTLDQAYGHCQQLARDHYENFPVASWLLPAPMRPHVAAIYAFARTADDFADEGDRAVEERLRLLDDWGARLAAAAAQAPLPRDAHEPVFAALAASMRACRLPVTLFEDLLSAFRQDVTTTRYETWNDVLDYCRRSANPVGRLVLRVAGYDDPRLDRQSDAICTALQLTNFWQDLERDYAKGRVYLPREISARAGAREADLAARRLTPAWREALGDAAARTRALFAEGRPLCDAVRGRLRWEVRATWLGGTRVLERLDAAGDVAFTDRPSLSIADGPVLLWRMITWTRGPGADAR